MTQSPLPFDGLDGGGSDDVEQVDEVVVYSDGGSRGNPGPSAIGAVVLDGSTEPPRLLSAISEYIGITTNNVAEYQALIAALRAAVPYRARVLRVRADSDLIVRQLRGEYRVRQPHLRPLYEEAKALLAGFPEVDLQHVRREHNTDADALVNAALDAALYPMILWFFGVSVFLVWNVFQSSGLDFRLIAIGAFLPLVVDLPFGEQAYAHALLSAVVVLVVTMAATIGRGRRLRRRRALSFAIGWFVGLVLSAAWANASVFWWPFLGARDHVALLPPWPVVVVEELAGLAALWWAYRRFGLGDPARRRVFAESGRLTIAART